MSPTRCASSQTASVSVRLTSGLAGGVWPRNCATAYPIICTTSMFSVPAVSEKSVGRPRQAEIFAQRCAFVVPPEQTAPLQFRHHALDEIVEPAGQVGKHDCETVGAFGDEPLLHLVSDGRGRADHGETGIAAKALGKLPHRELLALR